jgi:SAM-dependent methyltransferase
MADIGFVNLSGGDYRLSASSVYRNAATDGGAVGCNIDARRPWPPAVHSPCRPVRAGASAGPVELNLSGAIVAPGQAPGSRLSSCRSPDGPGGGLMIEAPTIRIWEHAEIERSEIEAARTPPESLYLEESNLRRYLDPPADTPYPLEYVFHLLGPVEGKKILDYGCGNGQNSILLARRRARVLGLDISTSLLDVARRRMAINGLDGAAFLAASAHGVPLPDESVDLVIGIAILHHLDLARASREVQRILKPGGRAIFQEPVRNSSLVRFVRRLIPYRSEEVSDYERPLTDAELRAFAEPFGGYRARAFSLPFINLAWVVPFLRPYLLRLYRLDAAILRWVPPLERFAGVRVIEIRKTAPGAARA